MLSDETVQTQLLTATCTSGKEDVGGSDGKLHRCQACVHITGLGQPLTPILAIEATRRSQGAPAKRQRVERRRAQPIVR